MVVSTSVGTSAARPTTAPSRAAGWVLGVVMGVANALGYVFTLLLTRALGPEEFGAFYAINATGLLMAIPAGALQIVVARRYAAHADGGLRLAVGVGLGLVAVGALISPLAMWAYHLDGPAAVALAMTNLLPMAVTGAVSGVLLGAGRLVALSSVTAVTAVSRVVVAGLAMAGGWTVAQVFIGLLVAGAASAAWGLWLARRELSTGSGADLRGALRELWRSNRTLAGLIALASIDVLLARHFLSANNAGGYSLAAVFGRVVFWGTQFLALTIVPALHPQTSRRRILEASGTVLVLGGLCLGVVMLVPAQLVRLTGGAAYEHAEGLLPLFVLFGTLLGLVQVLLYADMAADEVWLGNLTWAACVIEAVAVALWWHDNAFRILGAAIVTAGMIVVVGFVRVLRATDTPIEDGDPLVPVL